MTSCCNDYGMCERGPGCPAGSIVATKLLAGEPLPELEPYEFGPSRFVWPEDEAFMTARQQALAAMNSEPWRSQANAVWPASDDPTEREPWLTPARVLVGFLVFLAVCVGVAMASLNYWR